VFTLPTAEWDSLAPKIQKCTHCADRSDQPVPFARNGQALSLEESTLYRENIVTPACVKACPADCLRFGTRDEILQEAQNRISSYPEKYVDHIYGENEAGGTSVLYLSSVPFEKLGFPMLAPSRILRSPKWLCMPFPRPCWLWAPCWVARMHS